MPPPQALRPEEPRKPHPRSLVRYAELLEPGDADVAEHKRQQFVPPLAHRRMKARSPLEVRIRANILAVLGIDLVAQQFRAHFFVEATWVRCGRGGPHRACAWLRPACVARARVRPAARWGLIKQTAWRGTRRSGGARRAVR